MHLVGLFHICMHGPENVKIQGIFSKKLGRLYQIPMSASEYSSSRTSYC